MNLVVPLALCCPIGSTQESGGGSQVWGKCSSRRNSMLMALGGDCPPQHLPLITRPGLYSGFLPSPLLF